MIQKILPYYLKVEINIIKNTIIDIINGNYFRYANKKNKRIRYKGNIQIIQEIKQTKTTSAKLNNIKVALKKIEEIQINPNEVFSFWKTVGRPSKKNGYIESRSIVNGQITPTIGGGLCQLSGLIYYASLLANLETIERHNHSKDIYTDKTRFTPLGSDAAVVYGFKDLKIKNNLKESIRFSFLLEKNNITIRINSTKILDKNNLDFIKKSENEIITYVNGNYITSSYYK